MYGNTVYRRQSKRWNEENPDKQIKAGCEVVFVNGSLVARLPSEEKGRDRNGCTKLKEVLFTPAGRHLDTRWDKQGAVFSRTNVCRVKNAMKLGICSCKTSHEKWREKFVVNKKSGHFLRKEEQHKTSPENSHGTFFPTRLPRTVSGENFTAALLHALQR